MSTSRGLERVDLDLLTDADGRRYAVDASFTELEGVAPRSETTLRPSDARPMSIDERERAWQRMYPDAEPATLWEKVATLEERVEAPLFVDPEVANWLERGSGDLLEVVVSFRDAPALELPRDRTVLVPDLLDQLDEATARVLAAADHQTRIAEHQAPWVEAIEARGGQVTYASPVRSRLHLTAPADALRWLSEVPEVARIDVPARGELDFNGGVRIRHLSQIKPFLDEDYDGDEPSGLDPLAENIVVGVADSRFDPDHPAIAQRLQGWLYFNGTDYVDGGNSSSAATVAEHGQVVVGQLIANAYQDPSSPTFPDEASGMTTQSSLVFFAKHDPGNSFQATLDVQLDWVEEYATGQPLDVVNFSQSNMDADCDADSLINEDIDDLFLLDAFVVNTPGNEGHGSAQCTVRSPGMAAGSFTVNPYRSALGIAWNGSAITENASRGSATRAVIDMVAIGGRADLGGNTPVLAVHDDAYVNPGSDPYYHDASSFAAPVVAGAAANLKHNLIEVFSPGLINDVRGSLFASMLLMGDGQLESGTADSADPGPDPLWGMGRLRMRMIHPAGLDAPYGFHLYNRVLDDGESIAIPIHDGQALPSSVDTLRVTLFWFEPGFTYGGGTADVAVQLCDDTNTCYDSGTTEAGVRRLIAPDPGDKAWTLHLDGVAIPASQHDSYGTGETARLVRVAALWEQRHRDDADGPTCEQEIDMDCDACCALPGQTCVVPCPL